jgi:imidazolonepropionase-like amidohydrolase
MTYYWDQKPDTRPWEQLVNRSSQMTVFLSQENARKTLETGVTTVRDLGAADYNDIAMRELINRGAMLGPRMLVAGWGLQITDEPLKPGFSAPPGGRADGVPEVMRVARQQLAAGVDWVKMYGSTGSGEDVTTMQTFSYEEMKAAADTAHRFNKRIAIHSYGASGARDAVRAGADSVEHSVDIDDATFAEMVRRKTFYVPTIDHNRYYAENARQFGYTALAVSKLRAFIQTNLETTRRAHRAGVRIAMGSDAVMTMHGQNTHELEWFIQAGMTPAQALATATSNAATLLGLEKSIGTLAPGYYADIVAVEGDPLADIKAVTQGVRWVMRSGWVVVNRVPRAPASTTP